MSETKNKNKRRLSFTLSLFPTNNNNSFQTFSKIKSPKIFQDSNGVVGLGIVAAMHDQTTQDPLLANNKSSKPVPVLSKRDSTRNLLRKHPSFEKMEMSEEYTCVIAHVGKNIVKKKEYFVGDLLGVTEDLVDDYSFTMGQSGQVASNGWTVDFLNSCFLCKKKLHGLDIFMYRGETAFCSAECRYKQISVDDREKCGSSMMISPTDSFQCFTGVTAT